MRGEISNRAIFGNAVTIFGIADPALRSSNQTRNSRPLATRTRYSATPQGLVLSRSSSRAFRRNVGNFCQDRDHVIARSRTLPVLYSRPTSRARTHVRRTHARTNVRTHARTQKARESVWKQRHARTTLHLLCIYTTWL